LARVVALLREDLRRGFALAGVEARRVDDAPGLRAALEEALHDASCGMVIVDEELMGALEPETRARYAAVVSPLIIEVPGALQWREEEALPFDDYVAALVRRAVGYQLNLKL
jgi:vacuolar-type H+-ATPase subunit F/Vma7